MEARDDDPPGRDEFKKLYPTDQDRLFADINQCPPHLRHHFEMFLLDGHFNIPTVPYLPVQHQQSINRFEKEDPVGFNIAMEEFVKGVGGQYFHKNPDLPPTDTSSTASYSSRSGRQHYTVPAIKSWYAVVTTQRPELFSSSVYQRQAASKHSTLGSCSSPALLEELAKCEQAITLEKELSEQLAGLAAASEGHPVLQLEDGVIAMMAAQHCIAGAFYCSVFSMRDTLYVRYMQAGCFLGGFEAAVYPRLSELYPGCNQVFFWEVLNERDAKPVDSSTSPPRKKERKDKREERPDKIYRRHLRTNKSSVNGCLGRLSALDPASQELKYRGVIVLLARDGHQQVHDKQPSDNWFFYMTDVSDEQRQNVERDLEAVCLQPALPSLSPDGRPSPSTRPFLTMKEQCVFLNTITNVEDGIHRKLTKRFSCSTAGPPLSRRNRVIWAYGNPSQQECLVSGLTGEGRSASSSSSTSTSRPPADSATSSSSIPIQDPSPEPATTSANPSHPVTLTPQDITNALKISGHNVSPTDIQNMQSQNFTVFSNFKFQLHQYGFISLRFKSEQMQIFCINDCHPSKGTFMSSSFIHCSELLTEEGFVYSCSCSIYRTLLDEARDVSSRFSITSFSGVKCVHGRLLDEVRQGTLHKVTDSTTEPVLCICSSDHLVKFSVAVGDSVVIFNLSKQTSTDRRFANCTETFCISQRTASRSLKTLGSGSVCVHLQAVHRHPELWQGFMDTAEEESAVEDMAGDQENLAAPLLDSINTAEVFNPATGKWHFPCLSTHAARPDTNAELQNSLRSRDAICLANNKPGERDSGCIIGPNFVPSIPQHTCDCQAGWSSTTFPDGKVEFSHSTTLYTQLAPVRCHVYIRLCLNGSCTKKWTGEDHCIHVYSKETCAGDEIGNSFVNQALLHPVSFTSYCTYMSQFYKMRDSSSRDFMSAPTFRNWMFSWMANQQLEFRQPCKGCGFNPKVLACDGTKIGSIFRNIKVHPIETPADLDTSIPTLHRRNYRCFLNYPGNRREVSGEEFKRQCCAIREACENLMWLTKCVLDEAGAAVDMNDFVVNAQSVYACLPPACKLLFQRFVGNMQAREKQTLAAVFKMLATTAPLSAFIPAQYVPCMQELLAHLDESHVEHENRVNVAMMSLQNMRQFAPELRNFIAASLEQSNNFTLNPDVSMFVTYILTEVRSLPYVEADVPLVQEGTYNPPKFGRAYYFTPHGCQLRNVRQFSIDHERNAQNHDDEPHDFEKCSKSFPQVSTKGTSHLFLWFCAKHGHCYGFHIIPGSEGRKDPFASMLTHMEEPPSQVFYDFACNLHEYTLNRESGFGRSTKFFHDIFHGYSHKCSPVYKSSRLLGFEGVNTEICEQFNSFIQCLKYTVRQMSQVHFVFYLQYFIHAWNRRKAARYEQHLLIALAGTR